MTRHNLLLPIDGTRHSRAIVPQIQQLYAPEAWTITLLRVAPMPQGLQAIPRQIGIPWTIESYESAEDVARAQHPIYETQAEASARASLSEAELPIQQQLEAAGYDVTVEVRFGEPADEIVEFANASQIDLIAMAVRNRLSFRHLLFGSIAEQVLEQVEMPVMLFRPHGHESRVTDSQEKTRHSERVV